MKKRSYVYIVVAPDLGLGGAFLRVSRTLKEARKLLKYPPPYNAKATDLVVCRVPYVPFLAAK